MSAPAESLDNNDPFTHLDIVGARHTALSSVAHALTAVLQAPGTNRDRAVLLQAVIEIYSVGLPVEAPPQIFDTLASLSVILDRLYDESVVMQAIVNLWALTIATEAEYMCALDYTRDL